MESDTLNPTHTERHTQKGYTLGFFILSLSLETEKKSRNNSKNERGLTLYFPTTTSATGASRILLYSKRFLTLRESEYTTERERERERDSSRRFERDVESYQNTLSSSSSKRLLCVPRTHTGRWRSKPRRRTKRSARGDGRRRRSRRARVAGNA